jgi:hypothetical protein
MVMIKQIFPLPTLRQDSNEIFFCIEQKDSKNLFTLRIFPEFKNGKYIRDWLIYPCPLCGYAIQIGFGPRSMIHCQTQNNRPVIPGVLTLCDECQNFLEEEPESLPPAWVEKLLQLSGGL